MITSHKLADDLLKLSQFLKSKNNFEIESSTSIGPLRLYFFDNYPNTEYKAKECIKSLGQFDSIHESPNGVYTYIRYEQEGFPLQITVVTKLISHGEKIKETVETFKYSTDPEILALKRVDKSNPQEINELKSEAEDH